MLLQYIKKLTPEAMAELQIAKARTELLLSLDVNALLCSDLEGSGGKQPKAAPHPYRQLRIKKALSPFVEPGQELTIKENAIFCKEVGKKDGAGSMFLECGELPYYQHGISVFLHQGLQKNHFGLGPFYPLTGASEFFKEPVLLELACYFYNRLPLYKQIHELLLIHQPEYEKTLGKTFTEDLIALFSAEVPAKEPNQIKIPRTNLRKEILSSYGGKDQAAKKLMASLYSGLENHKEKGITGHYDTGNIKLDIFLRGTTKLVINTTLLFPLEDFEQTLEKAARDKSFNFAVNFRIEEWLRQYIFMANFGMKILEKVKTKLLLENV